jgi:serine/threonine-protein kinase
MAPEYIADGLLDHRADLYALGVVLFELATGAHLFEGPPFKILHQHVTAPRPDLERLHPGVSPELAALVRNLLATDPADRLDSAATVAHRLAALEAP